MKTIPFIEKLYRKPYLFRRITTLTIEEFTRLATALEPEWKEREKKRLLDLKDDRINTLGQGRPYELKTFPNLLLATIVYLRTTLGYDLLGCLFHIDPTTVKRLVRRVTPLLQDRFIPLTQLTKRQRRTNKLDDLLKEYPELKDIILDGTELPIQRPKRRQRYSYSGKKKRHTKKTIIALDTKTKLIVGVSPPVKGRIHDKRQLEQTGWDKKLSEDIKRRGDLGFYGMQKENSWYIPHKKPRGGMLTKKEKRENRQRAKKRIYVEHGIRGVKIFRRVGETIKVKTDEVLFTTLLAAANLYNFKRLVRQGI